MKSTKVAITGGHLAPAQALTDSYIKEGVPVIFLGRKSAFAARKDITLEYKTLSTIKGVSFYEVPAPRFKLKDIPLLFKGVSRCYKILSKERPDKLISFGGYIGLPAAIAAAILGIPVYLHEQTINPGRANLLCARFAKHIFTAFPEAAAHFNRAKTTCIGNPLRQEAAKPIKPDYLNTGAKKPLLIIMGGSTGSHSINTIIEKNLSSLTERFTVVHQIGDSEYGDYERLIRKKTDSYIPVQFISASELSYLYQHARLTISRSGANTFFDLIYFEVPALLVPLPWSARDEQLMQARLLENRGVAKVWQQHQENEQFLTAISDIEHDAAAMKKNFSRLNDYKKLIISPDILLHAIERD